MDAKKSQDKLIADLIYHAGYGINKALADLTTNEQWIINSAIEDGWLRFSTPAPIPGERKSHEWSFLRPMFIMTFPSGKYVAGLPENYGGMDGSVHFYQDTQVSTPITMVNETQIESMQSGSPSLGRPLLAATRPVKDYEGNVTSWELMVFPKTDRAYELTWKGRVVSDLDEAFDSIAIPGTPHFLTVKAACLAELELRLDGSESGPMEGKYVQQLIASVKFDRQSHSPVSAGYNYDRSDGFGRHSRKDLGEVRVSYNGTVYEG